MRKTLRLPVYIVMGLLFAALIVTVLGGCSTAERKPAPAPGPQAAPAPSAPAPTPVRNMPTNMDEVNRISKNLAVEAARVPGVKDATVVISGNTAYVGADIQAGTERTLTNRIKTDVAEVVKRKEPRLTNVLVSTDADTVTRLNKVGDGLAKGQPMSAFDNEMAEIARRMSPTAR